MLFAQIPATLVDLGAAAPTPGTYDISQLSITGQANKPDGLNYYTDNQVSYGSGEPGQTFTTSNTTSGYVLKSLAIKTGGGSSSGTGTAQGYLLHIYSVSEGNVTLLVTYSATNFAFADGDWLRWSGLSVALTNSSVYAYSFGKLSAAGPGWDSPGNAGGNPYTGGELGMMPVAGGAITFGASHAYDAVFDIGLTTNGPPGPPVVTVIQAPAKLTDLGATTPSPAINDVFQFSTTGDNAAPDGLNYYTDDEVNQGNGEPGQTFITPNLVSSYIFDSLAIKTGGGTTSGTTTDQGYLLHIYSVTGSNATLLAVFSATNFAFNDGDWLLWSGFSLSLTSNVTYAYSFGKASNATAGWEAMANASGNPYSGGELGLLPVAGGAITFGISHAYDATFDVGLIANGPPGPPMVTNVPASAIQATSATLNGKLVALGGSIPQVTIYYGPANGGANAAAWAYQLPLGNQSNSFAVTVTGLHTNTTYYFTATATNATAGSWAAPSLSFNTPTVGPPTVTNLPATGVAAYTASMNGQVVNTGNQWPVALVYYGTTDGGTNPAAWAGQASVGVQSGVFSLQAAGLAQNTTYYYNTFVSNSAGFGWGGPSLSFTTLNLTKISVLTYHYDNTRQGQNTNETLLSPANVNMASFGKLFSYPVDGYVYAQPLIVTNLNIPGKGVRDVLLVATMNDSVYAFDANNNGDANGGLLWKTNLGVASPSPSTEYGTLYHAVGNLDVVPEEGMAAAPVIDPVSGTIYMDAFTREVVAGVSTNYFHRIHALNITNGNEQPYSPVVVKATVPGTGLNGGGTGTPQTTGTTVSFNAVQHMERPALTLAGGILYLAYGSHDDTNPYHGWVFGYNPTNLTQVSAFNTTPNSSMGAIWMGGDGLCVDASNNIYFETGNGPFDANTGGGDYSDSFVKLATATNRLAVADYFTPYNQAALSGGDTDLGSGGPLLLPDSVGSTNHPHLIVGAGKEGKIYLVDRDNMGHYNSANDNQIVQELPGAIGGVWSAPAYFNHRIYYNGNGDVLKAFLITNGVLVATPDSESATSIGFPGATPTISANGTNNGIAWVIDDGAYLSSGPAVLHAYNATNLAIELYNSSQNLSRDNPGPAVKMVPPVIAGGKVYVGAQYAVSVFGAAAFLAGPAIAPNGGPFVKSVQVVLSDSTPGTSIYYTLDGTAPTTSSPLYTSPLTLTNTLLLQAIAAAPGAVNSAIASASFVDTAAVGGGAGLLGQYFANHPSANPFTGSPALLQTNATINFNWGTTGPSPAVGATNFTVRWTGLIQPQFNETYNFYTTADDGVRLYLNGQLVINNWVDETSAITSSNSITLAAQQFYNIELDYYQKTNNASIALSWSSPSTPLAIVPSTQLYPYTNPPPTIALVSPTNGASYTASASVTLSAQAEGAYNPLAAVSFFTNNILVGAVTSVPYTLTATGLGAGSYTLTAVASDASGLSSTSAPVIITVVPGTGVPYGLTATAPLPAFLNMPTTFNGTLPAQLSLTGVYTNTPNRAPAGGLIPYVPNTPLWSDGAVKIRYLAVPNSGGLPTPGQQIAFAPTGSWTFPAGTVFVKNFDLVVNATNASVPLRRLETRLLVRDINGTVYGVTYKWRPDNSDADLLLSSSNENILITNTTGISTQTWYYPSPADCLTCHTPVANYVLGVSTRQLNGPETYPSTGVTDNQLRTLNQLGLFNPAFDEGTIAGMEQLSSVTNLTASPEQRGRSYLDANCAQCHQPGGTGITFDARYDTPLASQNITNYPAGHSLGFDNACIIKADDVWRSMIWQRMNTTNPATKMPPLARNLIDTNGVAAIAFWVNSLPGIPALAPPVISPNGGNYVGSVGVTLTPPDNTSTLYYTLDGSLPTTNSLVYSGAFNIFTNATISANAFEPGYNNSVAASVEFQVQPLYFTTPVWLAGGQLQLGFFGVPGSNYVLSATTNFINWTPVATNLAPTNLFNFFDPGASNYPYRFYRVQQP